MSSRTFSHKGEAEIPTTCKITVQQGYRDPFNTFKRPFKPEKKINETEVL